MDPEIKRRGQAKQLELAGRPAGSKRAYEKGHKPIGAPTLRRDPTAPEKLSLLARWEQAAEDEGTSLADLPSRLKRDLEVKWHWKYETIKKWHELKTALAEVVSRLRLGLRGLRPFGSRKPLSEIKKCTGARLRVNVPGVATKQRPLETVMHRVHLWFNNEREHRQEVREKTLLTRLKY